MPKKLYIYILFTLLLTSCGFHLREPVPLAPPLQSMYIQTQDPYSPFIRNLKQYLKMSGVRLAHTPQEAKTILNIMEEGTTQDLLSINSSQQTRQYSLKYSVIFEILSAQGKAYLSPQSLIETRTLTLQSNQVLAGSNQAALLYQDMRRAIAYNIMNRLASKEFTQTLMRSTPRHENH
jgi:LPS-assembly lipoprotein